MVRRKETLRILCPNGHLGFAPTKEESFWIGAETRPDYYCCDSGSDDIGPVPLGTDTSVSPYDWQLHDLELMLLAARRQGVPMMIGSAGDTGTNSRVERYIEIIRKLARKHRLRAFKLVAFYSELDKAELRRRMESGVVVAGLDNRPALTREELEATERIVAMAGVHPFMKALALGADVVIGGRSSDAAIFAAAALHEGFPEEHAYYLGKVLECASFCAEPYMAKETVIGTVTHRDVTVTAMHPAQRCTVASVAGHAMYERSNAFYEHFAGGTLDMTGCRYEQVDEKSTRVTGQRFLASADGIRVKLEGSGRVGERFIGIVGIRDPYSIRHIDQVIGWARSQVEERFAGRPYELYYHVYGRNGVMGELEPVREIRSHELCIVVEGVAPTAEMAEEVTLIGSRQIFYARLPEVKGTAGTAAFVIDGVLPAPPAYRWTLNHVLPVADPLELFPIREMVIRDGEEGA